MRSGCAKNVLRRPDFREWQVGTRWLRTPLLAPVRSAPQSAWHRPRGPGAQPRPCRNYRSYRSAFRIPQGKRALTGDAQRARAHRLRQAKRRTYRSSSRFSSRRRPRNTRGLLLGGGAGWRTGARVLRSSKLEPRSRPWDGTPGTGSDRARLGSKRMRRARSKCRNLAESSRKGGVRVGALHFPVLVRYAGWAREVRPAGKNADPVFRGAAADQESNQRKPRRCTPAEPQ